MYYLSNRYLNSLIFLLHANYLYVLVSHAEIFHCYFHNRNITIRVCKFKKCMTRLTLHAPITFGTTLFRVWRVQVRAPADTRNLIVIARVQHSRRTVMYYLCRYRLCSASHSLTLHTTYLHCHSVSLYPIFILFNFVESVL